MKLRRGVGSRGGVGSRRVEWIVGIATGLLLSWLAVMTVVLRFPTKDHPTKTDAILVLGPPGRARLTAALDLIERGVSTQLVISVNNSRQIQANQLCQHPPAGVTVTCFHPDPATTRGEGRELQRLVAQHGWKTVSVVTSEYHLTRARFIMHNCTKADVSMVNASTEHISLGYWAYQYLYQTAGFIKAFAQTGC